MSRKMTVDKYMSENVETVIEDMEITELLDKMRQTGHDGFPVCTDGKLTGYVRAENAVLYESDKGQVIDIMDTDYPTFESDLNVQTAGRIMFRDGKSEVPVINGSGELVGLITNTDIIRSQIERTTPRKVDSLVDMLSRIHGDIDIEEFREDVDVDTLRPSQDKIYRDELQGRKYEIENGLAEPIVIVRTPSGSVVADGHHRIVASSEIEEQEIQSYVINIKDDIELGLIKQAESQGLESVDDIRIIENESHPQVEKIQPISKL